MRQDTRSVLQRMLGHEGVRDTARQYGEALVPGPLPPEGAAASQQQVDATDSAPTETNAAQPAPKAPPKDGR